MVSFSLYMNRSRGCLWISSAAEAWEGAGLDTNSVIFCRLFTIKDRCEKVRFQQTHNQ